MSDLDPANVVDATPDGANDEEDLAAAYEALAEDRRHHRLQKWRTVRLVCRRCRLIKRQRSPPSPSLTRK